MLGNIEFLSDDKHFLETKRLDNNIIFYSLTLKLNKNFNSLLDDTFATSLIDFISGYAISPMNS